MLSTIILALYGGENARGIEQIPFQLSHKTNLRWLECGPALHVQSFVNNSDICTSLSQDANNNDDYSSINDVEALLLVAGDPAAEDEPMRKGTCLQVSNIAEVHIRRQ